MKSICDVISFLQALLPAEQRLTMQREERHGNINWIALLLISDIFSDSCWPVIGIFGLLLIFGLCSIIGKILIRHAVRELQASVFESAYVQVNNEQYLKARYI